MISQTVGLSLDVFDIFLARQLLRFPGPSALALISLTSFWPVSFLSLDVFDIFHGPSAFKISRTVGLSLDVFDIFLGPYVTDSVVLVADLLDRRKNTLVISEKTPLIAMHSKSN